jgi:hypothetical protein
VGKTLNRRDGVNSMDLTDDFSRVAVILGGYSMVRVNGLSNLNKTYLSFQLDKGNIFEEFKDFPQGRELFESHLKEEMQKYVRDFRLTRDESTFQQVLIILPWVFIDNGYDELALKVVVDSLPFMDNYTLFERNGVRNNVFMFIPYLKEKQELGWRPDEMIHEDMYA